jgi:hypothetical protein
VYFVVFNILLFTLVFGMSLHVLAVRRSNGKNVYSLVILIFNVCLGLNVYIAHLLNLTLTVDNILLALLFVESFVLSYCFVLVVVVSDSPTLAITKALISKKPSGMTEEDWKSFIKSHPFVSSRVSSLHLTGDLVTDGYAYKLSNRSKIALLLIDIYRKVIRVDRQTG